MGLLDDRLGTVTLSPLGPVTAGEMGEWTLTYTVGSYGIDEGGTIKVARRFASDWGRPQFDDPQAPGYTTVRTDGAASLRARYDPKAHVRPWMKCLVIDVYDGCLSPGDTVTIVFGDRSEGSPGIRSQSFIESAHEIRVLVDPTNACLVERLPSSPVVAVVAGTPTSVVAIVPTDAVIGEPAKIFLKGEDRWGNPTTPPDGVALAWEGDASARIEGDALVFSEPGTGRVVASWNGEPYPSNPCTATERTRPLRRYWGDLHAQSDATVGTGTEVEYFTFGRDWAHLDIMSHQGNDFQMTDEDWKRLNDVVREFHEDGRFVVFPGYEWSANTPAGGDRNVVYLHEDMPIMRSSHWQIPDTPEDERSPAHPATDLFEKLRKYVPMEEVLLMAHCGGRYADIREQFDEELGPLVEVCSCWGVFEWLLWDAFERGYRVGIVANSDGHKGRPGAEGPGAGQFGIFGGLTCVLSPTLTRVDVFAALRERRCYGTTGPRIDLEFAADGHPMGSIYRGSGVVTVEASVHAVAPIEGLEIWRGRERVHVERPTAFADLSGSRRVRLSWGGARIRGRGRRAVWDGSIEVSGARIVDARPYAFDSPADGIRHRTDARVEFESRTTGDLDGVDLWLDHGDSGRVVLRNEFGELSVDLPELGPEGVRVDFGGLDLHARIDRYPEHPTERRLALRHEVERIAGATTPIFVKAIQTDGHIAWASPVYVD